MKDYNYSDTDSLTDEFAHDCDFCRNACTNAELSNDNDLSYKACGITSEKTRMLFRTGDGRKTELIIEQYCTYGWKTIAVFTPNHCPFCGRLLYENLKKYSVRKFC